MVVIVGKLVSVYVTAAITRSRGIVRSAASLRMLKATVTADPETLIPFTCVPLGSVGRAPAFRSVAVGPATSAARAARGDLDPGRTAGVRVLPDWLRK
jgi:hypothetical protein